LIDVDAQKNGLLVCKNTLYLIVLLPYIVRFIIKRANANHYARFFAKVAQSLKL